MDEKSIVLETGTFMAFTFGKSRLGINLPGEFRICWKTAGGPGANIEILLTESKATVYLSNRKARKTCRIFSATPALGYAVPASPNRLSCLRHPHIE